MKQFKISFIIFGLFITSRNVTAATTYYVDASTSLTVAQRLGTNLAPFKTLQEAIAQVQSTGGTILLKSGYYKGPFLINNALLPIAIQTAPLQASTAVLQCSSKISNWTVHSGSIYKAQVTGPVSQIFYTNPQFSSPTSMLKNARYPQTGYLSVASTTPLLAPDTPDLNSLFIKPVDRDFLAPYDTTNMQLSTRNIDYWFTNSVVTGFDKINSKFTLSNAHLPECDSRCSLHYGAMKDWGYFLKNKLWMLTQAGQWVYEAGQGTLYVWLPSNVNPNAVNVEADSYQDCFTIQNSNRVTLTNLNVNQIGGSALVLNNSDNFSMSEVSIRDVGRRAVNLLKAKGFVMQNSTIAYTAQEAIFAENSTLLPTGTTSSGNQVIGNTFSYVGMAAGPHFIRSAVFFAGEYAKHTVISNNTFSDTPYVALIGGSDAQILGNTFSKYCLWLDDCAAIYASVYFPTGLIEKNIISGSTANVQGKASLRGPYPVAGIYLDDFIKGVTVRGNQISGAPIGLMLHNGRDNIIENNSISNASDAEFRAQEDKPISTYIAGKWVPTLDASGNTSFSISNNVIRNNELIDTTGQRTLSFTSNQGGTINRIRTAFSFSGNKYSGMLTNSFFETSSNILPTPTDFKTFKSQLETNAVDITNSLYGPLPMAISSTSNGIEIFRLGSSLGGFSTFSRSQTQTFIPMTLCSLSSNCWRFTSSPTDNTSLLISPPFSIDVDAKIRIKMKIYNGLSVTKIVRIIGRRNSPGWENVTRPGASTISLAPLQWTTVDFSVRGSDTLTNARVDLEVPTGLELLVADFAVNRVVEATVAPIVSLTNRSRFLMSSASTLSRLTDEGDCTFSTISGRCLKLYGGDQSSLIISDHFPMIQGQVYRVRLNIFNPGSTDKSISVAARKNEAPWDLLDDWGLPGTRNAVARKWTFTEWYFRAKISFTNARVDVSVPASQDFIFKNFEVTPVTASLRNNSKYISSFINTSKGSSLAIPCNNGICTGWQDTSGQSVLLPSTVAAKSSLIIWNKEISTPLLSDAPN